MSNALQSIQQEALQAITQANTTTQLESIRVAYLGKKGHVTQQMQQLASLPVEEKKNFGAAVNQVKQIISDALNARYSILEEVELDKQLVSQTIDVTLPVRPKMVGTIHPVTQVMEECRRIFAGMGFIQQEGPEIEDDFHNFTALNIPENHPARQMQDTFYIDKNDAAGKPFLLRTHTSSVQIHAMQTHKPPFRFIAAGRVYRSDYDMTHTPMFHQIEGVYVDKKVHMGHLKGCLNQFLQEFFGLETVPLRFRPSFFPFTEPSAEVDIGCMRAKDQVVIGQGTDWLEILGCGMIHPSVLQNVDIDPNEYQGFAFGIGLERLAMLKYGAPDLRAFFDHDIRWLTHYGFRGFEVGGKA